MPDKITPVSIAQQWIDDLLPPGQHKLGEFVLLSCHPDSLHLGYNTHWWAAKNRNLGAILVPDPLTVSPPPSLTKVVDTLLLCDHPRQELREDENGWDWVDIPGKIWKLAPVDLLLPGLLTCDLATLASHSKLPLDRYTDYLLRRYSRIKGNTSVVGLDREWDLLGVRYTNLGLAMCTKNENKRFKAIAKARLVK